MSLPILNTGVGHQGWYLIPSSGTPTYYGYAGRVGSLDLTPSKVSVNTGKFIPGIYRVNPYSVKSSHFEPRDPRVARPNPLPSAVTNATGGNMYYQPIGGYMLWFSGEWWRRWMYEQLALEKPVSLASSYTPLALQKAYGKLGKAELPLGEDLGEIRETLKMLRSPLAELRKFLIDDNSRNIRLLRALAQGVHPDVAKLTGRTAVAASKAAASTWMELRYGFRPLYYLVQNVIELVNQKCLDAFDPNKIRSARSKLQFPVSQTTHQVTRTSGYCSLLATMVLEDSYKALASVQYTQTDPVTGLDRYGLTPRFIPETMWNLTTASFVWDWLFSIGPWIESLRVNPTVTTLGNSVGFRYSRKFHCQRVDFLLNDNSNRTVQLMGTLIEDSYYTVDSYVRTTNQSMPKLPHFTWGRTLDLYKGIDALSMIWQRLLPLLQQRR